MIYRMVKPEEIRELSVLSEFIGNIPFSLGECAASAMFEGDKIVGFVAVQSAVHAAGSWVYGPLRRQGHTYRMREVLENELKSRGAKMYFSLPGNDFEKALFAKYGPVSERIAQVKELEV
jgi:hypothetical protein